MNRFEMQEKLINELGIEEAFDSVVKALSDDQMKEVFDYICTCWGISTEEEEEEEE